MEPAPRTAGALDGKTLRGSFDHLHDRTTAHHEVPAAPDEIGGVQALIAELGVSGVLFTADALHCQKTPSPKPPLPATPCWSG